MGVTDTMAAREITLPRLGETMEEARVTDWLVQPGEAFARGQTLLEVETDKTVVEVPALADGVLDTQLVAPGDMVTIGQPIARVRGGAAEPAQAPAAGAEAVAERPRPPAPNPPAPNPPVTTATPARRAASPRARRIARQAGLDLRGIAGTGRRGRISGADVARARDGGAARPAGAALAVRRHDPPGGVAVRDGAALLLHGLFANGQSLAPLARRLAARGLPVLVPDLPAHGDSPDEAPGLDAAVAALAHLVETAAPPGPLRLFGHSMGAILAARLARRLPPGRVTRLVFSAPAGLGARLDRDFLDGMLGAETPAALRRALAMLGGGPLSDAALAAELAALRRHRPGQRALAADLAAGGVQQTDLAADIEGVDAPVAALFGTADRIVDWQACAGLPARAAIHLRAGIGHLPHLGAEALVADLMLQPGAAGD